jgi:hypothetical protein
MRSLIKDLKDEIEALQLEIDSTDENNSFFLKMQWCFPGYVSYNDTFVTTVFADSIIPLT